MTQLILFINMTCDPIDIIQTVAHHAGYYTLKDLLLHWRQFLNKSLQVRCAEL